MKKAKKAKLAQATLYEVQGYPVVESIAATWKSPFVATSDASIEAAEQIKPHGPVLREKVYLTIDTYGPLTDERIAYYTGLNPSTARPRRLELQREGRIVQAGHGTTSSGRKAALWAVA